MLADFVFQSYFGKNNVLDIFSLNGQTNLSNNLALFLLLSQPQKYAKVFANKIKCRQQFAWATNNKTAANQNFFIIAPGSSRASKTFGRDSERAGQQIKIEERDLVVARITYPYIQIYNKSF